MSLQVKAVNTFWPIILTVCWQCLVLVVVIVCYCHWCFCCCFLSLLFSFLLFFVVIAVVVVVVRCRLLLIVVCLTGLRCCYHWWFSSFHRLSNNKTTMNLSKPLDYIVVFSLGLQQAGQTWPFVRNNPDCNQQSYNNKTTTNSNLVRGCCNDFVQWPAR